MSWLLHLRVEGSFETQTSSFSLSAVINIFVRATQWLSSLWFHTLSLYHSPLCVCSLKVSLCFLLLPWVPPTVPKHTLDEWVSVCSCPVVNWHPIQGFNLLPPPSVKVRTLEDRWRNIHLFSFLIEIWFLHSLSQLDHSLSLYILYALYSFTWQLLEIWCKILGDVT